MARLLGNRKRGRYRTLLPARRAIKGVGHQGLDVIAPAE